MYLDTALFAAGFFCLIAFGLLAYVFNIQQQT
jgi:hypothetical protein